METTVEQLKEQMLSLPFVTAHLPGIGGDIKAEPEHFQVEEILPYAPCGEGEHVYVTLRRKLWNTADVAAALADCFDMKSRDVGWGGRKDRQAVTTQTFSLLLPLQMALPDVQARLEALPFDILSLNRHGNKIRTGHVAGNRFRILLTGVSADALPAARAIAEALQRSGVPNFYGPQRFGEQMHNLARAFQLAERGRPARGKKEAFMVSVLQSALFNRWLCQRMARGALHSILPGDVVQKTDTGGMFVVSDLADAASRFENRAVVYTGPIYGPKMKNATDQAGDDEAQILSEAALDIQTFKRLRAPGSRRKALLFIDDLTIQHDELGLWFAFTLPQGAYATVVMREFMRSCR